MAHQVDIAIITIRDDEFEAVLQVFPDELGDGVHRGRFREYALRKASAGKTGEYALAILRLPEQGNGEALDAARDVLEDLEPSLLLVVGIAGGLPSDDLSLGDVVLSTRINDYSVEARKEGAEPQYAISGGPIARKLQGGIANLAARRKDLGDWTANLPAKPAVNWTGDGQLYGPEEWQQELKAKLEQHKEKAASRPPRFTSGPIASSDRLVKDPTVLFPWIQTARNLLAVEMESGGVFRAARDRCLMLAIRALSDIVGLKRADAWTKYAAESAAAFARAYLQTCPIPPGSASPSAPTGIPSTGAEGGQPPTQNTLTITGGQVEAANIVVGVQNIYRGNTSSQSLDAVEKLVDNGLFDDASEQLDVLERSGWGSMSPVEKSRHRKMQGRILIRRGQEWAGAARYEEAASFVPDDEKAQLLRVHALMLRDDLPGAHELAGKLVAQYPGLVSAKAAWIRSAPSGTSADDLLPKPWDGLDPAIASALAHRLLDEERAKEALEVLQRAHSPGVDLAYWSAYTVALLKYQEQLGGQHGPPELLAEALPALEKALKLCVGDGLKQGKVQILLNMAYVHRLRGDLDEEWRVLRDALAIDPDHEDVRVRMAKLLTERGRANEAIPILEGLLRAGPDYVPFLLGVALAKRNSGTDLARAAELFEQTATIAAPSEAALLLDGAEGLVKVCCAMKDWDRGLAACARFGDLLGEFRAKELAARIYLERGDATTALGVLIEAAASSMSLEQQRTLGVLFLHAGDNDRAVEQLEPVVPRNEWTESTAALLNASQAIGRDELTIRVCRQLRAAGITRDSVVDAEATALFRRGELAAAIEVVEQALASEENRFLRLRLSTLGVAAGRSELIERDPARLPQPGDGDPHVAVVVVGVLRAAGVNDAAIRYAYDAYRANRSDASGWAAIIEAFNPTRGRVNHAEPDVVTVDSSVLIREGGQRRWITVEPRDPAAEHDELSPDSPLVIAMLGKRVGDSFAVPRGLGLARNYVVEEIRSKYVRTYQRCLEQWEEQFPNVPGPVMIEIPGNLAEDIEGLTNQLLPVLQANTQRVEEMERLYRDGPVTFHMLASGLRSSVFGAMSHLAAAPDLEVRCTRSTQEEIRQVLANLEGGQKIIVETSAISTLLLLGETDLLGDLAGRLAIARATVDQLRAHRREVETRGEGFLGLHDGRLTMREIDQGSRARYLGQVDHLLGSLAGCEVFHEQEHDRISAADWDRLVQIGGAGAVESLHRSMRTGETVWCDDMVLALVANQRGVRVAWTQLMCHHLMLRSEMDAERGCRISAKLVGSRYVSTNTNQGVYREAARLAMWNPDYWPLKEHLRLFEVEPWTDGATGLLAVNTLREWWRHAPSDAAANAVMVALLDRIALRPNGMDALIPAISRTLERAFGVDVLSYERARATFEGWRRARPLRQALAR